MRPVRAQAAAWITVWLLGSPVAAAARGVLAPQVHARGVDAATASAFELVLVQELERRSSEALVHAVSGRDAARACADARCASRRARERGAGAAYVCTLARFGSKHVATLQRVEAGGRIVWSERQASPRAEDLDELAARLAARLGPAPAGSERRPAVDPEEGPARAARRGRSGDRDVARIDEDSAPEPPAWTKRRGWGSSGPRAGVLYPSSSAYAGAERLTSLAYVWRYETPSWSAECTPGLGLAWGGDLERERGRARDWTLLDVFLAWTPARGDVAPWAGAGMGLHAVRLERDGTGVPFTGRRDESATTLGLQVGGGVTFFRTYDFQIGLDLRYQHLLHDFPEVGADGAHGFVLGFGIQHR